MTTNQTRRKIVAILAADVVGYSRLAGTDEDRTLARLRALRSDLIDPTIAVHNGRVVKRTGDGALVEFSSVVDAVRCAIEVQNGMLERNAGVPPERRIEFRIGVHLGDVVEESDGDLMGDSVNIAARLEGIAKPGTICLSEDAYRQIKARLDLVVGDLGEQKLKNIAEPIRAYSLEVGKPMHMEPPTALTSPRLSIVVLPFDNLGGDPEQEYFVDGVTESLTTDLSRISGAFVIARNSAFSYKGKSPDVRQVGRDLNVRYVLEGSVQRGGNRLRINVQLIDTENGNHLWAERFDKPVADLLDVQDEIVSRLANALDTQLIEAEARRAERALHPEAVDLIFRGRACFNKGLTAENMAQSRDFFEHALALDSGNIVALVGTARVDTAVGASYLTEDSDAHLSVAEVALVKALTMAPQARGSPRDPRHCVDLNQACNSRHLGMRTSADAGSKLRPGTRVHR
jgi:TolB-like protein